MQLWKLKTVKNNRKVTLASPPHLTVVGVRQGQCYRRNSHSRLPLQQTVTIRVHYILCDHDTSCTPTLRLGVVPEDSDAHPPPPTTHSPPPHTPLPLLRLPLPQLPRSSPLRLPIHKRPRRNQAPRRDIRVATLCNRSRGSREGAQGCGRAPGRYR